MESTAEKQKEKMMNKLHLMGKISESDKYCALHPLFGKAFEFLKRPDIAELPPGRYEIDGEKCWASVQEVELKPLSERKLETHRKYIDIQDPLTGAESIGIAEMSAEAQALPFDVEKDFVLYDGEAEPVVLEPGDFAIFFPPLAAHAPCCVAPNGSDKIKKVVVKILAE
jgi:YhcH/YjgK/YiaL family protein